MNNSTDIKLNYYTLMYEMISNMLYLITTRTMILKSVWKETDKVN